MREGIKNGEFSTTLNPETFAFKMYASIEGGLIICRMLGNEELMQGLIDGLKQELNAYTA